MGNPTFSRLHFLGQEKYKHYLPTAFDESMTLLQKINKVIEFLNKVIEGHNDLSEEMEQFLTTFKDQLESVTDEQLQEWKDDGTLDQIINESILNSKSTIVVSDVEPTNITPDQNTFWYEETDTVNFSTDDSDSDGGVIVSDTEPSDTTKIWYDLE